MSAQTPRRGVQGPNAANYQYPEPDPARPPTEPVEVPVAQPQSEQPRQRTRTPRDAETPDHVEMRGPERAPGDRTEQGTHFRTSNGGPPHRATEPTAIGHPPRATSN